MYLTVTVFEVYKLLSENDEENKRINDNFKKII